MMEKQGFKTAPKKKGNKVLHTAQSPVFQQRVT